MSPRKKKDPIAAVAHEAAVAFAVEKAEASPRGAPDVFPVEHSAFWPGRPCALEDAPDGAKCIVSRTDEGKVARLLTPEGAEALRPTDLFYLLPASAKVRKVNGTTFEAYRLGVQEGPLFTVPTARLAVQRFLEVLA